MELEINLKMRKGKIINSVRCFFFFFTNLGSDSYSKVTFKVNFIHIIKKKYSWNHDYRHGERRIFLQILNY